MFDDLDLKMMLLTAMLFLMLLWILDYILYKPLLTFMKNRDDGIKEDEARIQQNNTDASNNETLIAKIYADARAKAQAIKSEQVAVAKEQASKAIAEKKASLDLDYQKFLTELEAKKIQFKNELKADLFQCENALRASIEKI
ncbi:F0F1 ATP synthase subunit B' [Campylobacter sp. RM12654]|uniref:F0F1 ATP synthase subunit B family protein n=1 Tax=unclassified Campylobacter TaxID=2593542 RepID=UPI001BD98C15|nr:F0F1 ATP synthase subunit B' [Campylobacter sp. 2018MI01]MBT0878926.1 F0F1 ATP synthase subunit B' [Campylobacter sp. 2018MI01]MBZ7977694.1 F0F1 ATP synthase subunit B' [Campylobacter sp. RM12654]